MDTYIAPSVTDLPHSQSLTNIITTRYCMFFTHNYAHTTCSHAVVWAPIYDII